MTSLVGRVLTARVLYAASPAEVHEVRSRIAAGFSRGALTGPDGRVSRWRLRTDQESQPLESEMPITDEFSRLGIDG